ncbi:MAG: hypothetical protein LBV79_04275 [Candidatus Adiutrix sp.]|jgi:general secretion pathway protein A|nr:hypothetical protein [Candidatus Adiutrix sp.]
MDYVKHFNLTDRPFKNTYDGRYFYRSAGAEAVFAALKAEDCPTLIHLKGLPKAGITSALRRLPVELRERFRTALILNPQMTLAEMLRQALTDFGHSHKFGPQSREEELLGYFQNSVSDFLAEGSRILLVVDSAEELSPAALAEFYGLMELEPEWRGRVYLLLGGSSEAPWPMVPDIMLDVRELTLPPLTPDETSEYVAARLKVAGGELCFSRSAVRALWEHSQGLPEAVNQLAERALIAAWSSGRGEVGPAQLKAARTSLDNPLTIDYEALEQGRDRHTPPAAGLQRGGRARNQRGRLGLSRGRLLATGLAVILLAAAGIHFFGPPDVAPVPAPPIETAAAGPPEGLPAPTATPAADNGAAEPSGAPSLPTPPPQVLSLPQGALALVVYQDLFMDQGRLLSRLWQGGARGAGLKGEIAAPVFKNGGLYLFGRPRGRNQNPMIFQYPPSRNAPRDEAKNLWPQVETLLPQNLLPVIVAKSADYNRARSAETEAAIADRVKAWVQSQQYRFPDTTAALYASSFQFFEVGRQARTIDREDFRAALNSEARTSGEVQLTTSQPLILQDPGQDNLVWAMFNLKYSSRLRNDLGIRLLVFEKSLLSQDNWLIVAELWLPERSLSGE